MLSFNTTDPSGLLAAIYSAIDKKHIETWSYDDKGDFTHSVSQWRFQAWMRPFKAKTALNLGIIGRADRGLTKEVYGIYHGRFNEMMLVHFDEQFTSSLTSALRDMLDNF